MSLISAGFRADEAARDFLSWLGEWLGEISAIDCVLLGFAAAIAYFLRKSLLAATRLGGVEVDVLECEATATATAEAHILTASLREQLTERGVSAPVVPSGTPQTTVLSAVAASPIPQAAFIAKLIEAMPIPQPLQYKLSGALAEQGGLAVLSYWLRPSGGGGSLMGTRKAPVAGVPGGYERVIDAIAFEVYSFISRAAPYAFPKWTRWNSMEALVDYSKGANEVREGKLASALVTLGEAVEHEPANALVCLQLANVRERIATENRAVSESDRLHDQAIALGEYLSIVAEWPWLVQARYRASVLAALLAKAPAGDAQKEIAAALNLSDGGGSQVESTMLSVAEVESAAVLQLLKPWYMLVRWQRPRSQFEPSARERHELKRAIGLSRQSLRVRSIKPAGDDDRRARRKNWRTVWWRRSIVQCHLRFGLVDMDWQTDYIAACFYALLLETPLRKGERVESSSLREKALSHLRDAIVEAGPGLPAGWILEGDPDLAPLRQAGKSWEVIARLLAKGRPAPKEATPPPGPPAPAPPPAPTARSVERYPSAPWPSAGRRIAGWVLAAAAASIVSVLLIASTTTAWTWLFVLLPACCFARAIAVARERAGLRQLSGRFAAGSEGLVYLTQRP